MSLPFVPHAANCMHTVEGDDSSAPTTTDADALSSQADLSASEGFFTLVDANPFGVYVVDADFHLARVSLGARSVFASIHPLIGRDFAEVLRIVWPEPFASHAIERFRHTLSTGEGYVARDATRRGNIAAVEEYDWRIERLMLPDGRYGIVCFFYDLSERVKWERALEDSQARLRLATEAAGIGIWSWHSGSDTMVWENTRPYEILGLSTDQPPVSAVRFADEFVLPAYSKRFIEALACAVRDATPFFFEGQIRRGDGATRWIQSTGTPAAAADDSAARLVGTIRDVTDQKDAEHRVRDSEARSTFARRSSGVGFWFSDLPFDVLEWDSLVKAHFHVAPDAIVTIQTFYDRIHPDDRDATRRAIESSIDGHGPYDVHYRTVHPETGRITHVRAIGRTFYDDAGAPRRFDGVTLDVTDMKLAEASLREANGRKDEFLATLSHELRNPLAPIRSGLEVIRLTNTNTAVERTRAMMDRQLTQLVRLVDDLLDVSRVTSDKLELRRTTLDLRAAIDAAIEMTIPTIRDANHDLTVSLPDEPVWVDGDLARLAQVLSNLLHNSAKYMHRGGRIRVTLRRDDADAVVSVADEGIGIPSAMLTRVFERFTQVDRALEKSTGGLGLGLSLVKGLVAMHGGTVEALSDGEGQGSEFIVRLPVVAAPPSAGDRSVATPEIAAERRRRILVADDNTDAAESLQVLLSMKGHDVRTVHDGVDAVHVAETFDPDVIVLDIGMPRLNGYDAARHIRAAAWGRRAVLIAMTGWGDQAHRTETVSAGFNHHLVKPVDIDALLTLIAGV